MRCNRQTYGAGIRIPHLQALLPLWGGDNAGGAGEQGQGLPQVKQVWA